MSLTFKYEPWNKTKDLLMENVSNSFAIAVVRNAIEISHRATLKEERRDTTIKPAQDGIIHLLAACIEWLRWFGMPSAEIENRVTALLAKERQSTRGQHRLTLGATVDTEGDFRSGNRNKSVDNSGNK